MTPQIEKILQIGDLIFIEIDILPFRLIAKDTGTWTNHVGIVISDDPLMVAESTFPLSKATAFKKFVGRSKNHRLAIKRPLVVLDHDKIRVAASKRMGVMYDTGFDLHSKRQFCSRYVHEVLDEAAGIKVGRIETLRALLYANSEAHTRFWRLWYFLRIPWERETITPASVFNDTQLVTIFDGYPSK